MLVRIFTDGACSENPGPGGWGAVFYKSTGQEVISGYETETTNNRMELMAFVEALKKIKKEHKEGNTYELYSDSAYVVNAVNSGWISKWRLNGWKTTKGEDIKNKDLWERYLKENGSLVRRQISLDIIKIKGHSGNAFNDHVDEVAKAEAKKARREIQGC